MLVQDAQQCRQLLCRVGQVHDQLAVEAACIGARLAGVLVLQVADRCQAALSHAAPSTTQQRSAQEEVRRDGSGCASATVRGVVWSSLKQQQAAHLKKPEVDASTMLCAASSSPVGARSCTSQSIPSRHMAVTDCQCLD